jgi:nucleotide-binding universal stress UspA family protein
MIEDDIPLKRIIVPLDGSDSSFRAAKYAIKVAKMANAEIIFVHAVVNPPYGDGRGRGL